MEVGDQIQCKFPRNSNGNGRLDSTKLGHSQKMDDQYPEEEEEGDKKTSVAGVRGSCVDLGGGIGRFYGWPSSRIVRVSRASGGKDRHSKVLTSKGLRDRRVRLSVNTSIQFYDLQDRLGYDQPSKAVEWLLKAAASSIAELPPMNAPFPDTPKQLSDENRSSTAFDSAEVDLDSQQQQQPTKSSACSSNSETSKGSGLSLSRSESRIKARERAKERVAEKEKEKEKDEVPTQFNPISVSQTTSFTELLNGGISINSSTPMDYFSSGLLAPPSSNPFTSPFLSTNNHHPEHQYLSFVPDHHLVPVGQHQHNVEYNLNFTICPTSANSTGLGLAGFNRGTLQSNSSSPSLLPHLRYPDGPAQSFFIGTADSHHQFLSGYCYTDANANAHSRHSTNRGKGKN